MIYKGYRVTGEQKTYNSYNIDEVGNVLELLDSEEEFVYVIELKDLDGTWAYDTVCDTWAETTEYIDGEVAKEAAKHEVTA